MPGICVSRIPIPFYKNTGDMKYSQTVNLTAGVEYDLTTTIPGAIKIYNVLPDYGGTDSEVDVTWAIVAGVWHIYLTSVDSLTGVDVKVIF